MSSPHLTSMVPRSAAGQPHAAALQPEQLRGADWKSDVVDHSNPATGQIAQTALAQTAADIHSAPAHIGAAGSAFSPIVPQRPASAPNVMQARGSQTAVAHHRSSASDPIPGSAAALSTALSASLGIADRTSNAVVATRSPSTTLMSPPQAASARQAIPAVDEKNMEVAPQPAQPQAETFDPFPNRILDELRTIANNLIVYNEKAEVLDHYDNLENLAALAAAVTGGVDYYLPNFNIHWSVYALFSVGWTLNKIRVKKKYSPDSAHAPTQSTHNHNAQVKELAKLYRDKVISLIKELIALTRPGTFSQINKADLLHGQRLSTSPAQNPLKPNSKFDFNSLPSVQHEKVLLLKNIDAIVKATRECEIWTSAKDNKQQRILTDADKRQVMAPIETFVAIFTKNKVDPHLFDEEILNLYNERCSNAREVRLTDQIELIVKSLMPAQAHSGQQAQAAVRARIDAELIESPVSRLASDPVHVPPLSLSPTATGDSSSGQASSSLSLSLASSASQGSLRVSVRTPSPAHNKEVRSDDATVRAKPAPRTAPAARTLFRSPAPAQRPAKVPTSIADRMRASEPKFFASLTRNLDSAASEYPSLAPRTPSQPQRTRPPQAPQTEPVRRSKTALTLAQESARAELVTNRMKAKMRADASIN